MLSNHPHQSQHLHLLHNHHLQHPDRFLPYQITKHQVTGEVATWTLLWEVLLAKHPYLPRHPLMALNPFPTPKLPYHSITSIQVHLHLSINPNSGNRLLQVTSRPTTAPRALLITRLNSITTRPPRADTHIHNQSIDQVHSPALVPTHLAPSKSITSATLQMLPSPKTSENSFNAMSTDMSFSSPHHRKTYFRQ